MNVIGITGPTGSGKSLVCDFLQKQNIPCIDADEVYHEMLLPPSECLDAIRSAFGDALFLPDGNLNRAALAEIVFNDSQKLELLNETVLGIVLKKSRSIIASHAKKGVDTIAVDAPTLIESGFHKECTLVISVLSSPKLRLERIVKRDSLSREAAEARIHAQKDDAFYREHSDFVLSNTDDRDTFFRACATLLRQLPIGSR